jgi:calcium permeable stress-gated cation channel
MATVGFVFAPLVPLVALAAAVVLWVSSWVYKYQLMFVFVSRVETGGVSTLFTLLLRLNLRKLTWHSQRLWNVVINRVLVAVMLMQLLVTLSKYARVIHRL